MNTETEHADIPARELLVWQDEKIRASLATGLAQSAAGDVTSRGDFTQYIEDSEATK